MVRRFSRIAATCIALAISPTALSNPDNDTLGGSVGVATVKPVFSWNAVPVHLQADPLAVSGSVWGTDDTYSLKFWQSGGNFQIQNLKLEVKPGLYGGTDTYLWPNYTYANEYLNLSKPLQLKPIGTIPTNAPASGFAMISVEISKASEWWQKVTGTIVVKIADTTAVAGVGWLSEGADVALSDINGNGKPEMFLMAVDPEPSFGPNTFRYKVGWDVNAAGVATWWTNEFISGAPGWDASGGGVAVHDINGNGTKDIILMMIDNPPGANTFKYIIGWDLSPTTGAPSWFSYFSPVGGVGWNSVDGGCAVTNLDSDPKPELVFATLDPLAADDMFRYVIGWNLDQNGNASWWQYNLPQITAPGWLTQGAGIAFAQLDNDLQGRPEMLLMTMDNPSGKNNARFIVGWNLSAGGIASGWTTSFPQMNGFAKESYGGGIAVGYIDNDWQPEFILMAYEDQLGPNVFRYGVFQW